jgi:hypothetical protein
MFNVRLRNGSFFLEEFGTFMEGITNERPEANRTIPSQMCLEGISAYVSLALMYPRKTI